MEELKAKSYEYRGQPAPSKGGAGASVKVIDMTGPQKRVLSGYDEIHNRHVHPDGASASKCYSGLVFVVGGGSTTPTLMELQPSLCGRGYDAHSDGGLWEGCTV